MPARMNSQGVPRLPPFSAEKIIAAKSRQTTEKNINSDSCRIAYCVWSIAQATPLSAAITVRVRKKTRAGILPVPQGPRELLFQAAFHGNLPVAIDSVLDIDFYFR